MRNYSRVSPQFWTGATGRALREAGRDAQVVALYLVTCPSATMSGLFYLPLPTLQHEVGITRARALAALTVLEREGFARYDFEREVVFVPEMARFQVGENLVPGDKRSKGLVRELGAVSAPKFVLAFYEKYRTSFFLPEKGPWEGLARPSEGASKALRSQEQEQEHEQEHLHAQEREQEKEGEPEGEKTSSSGRGHDSKHPSDGRSAEGHGRDSADPGETSSSGRGRDESHPGDRRSADATRLPTAAPSAAQQMTKTKTTKTTKATRAPNETSVERTARLKREKKAQLAEAAYDDDVPF